MKRIVIYLLLLSIPTISLAISPKFIAGISLANFHSVSGSYPVNPSTNTRFVAGIGLEIPFYRGQFLEDAKVIGELDFLFIQKGCHAETGDIRGNYNLDEISVPLLWKFKLFPGTSPFLMAGAEAAYVLSYQNKEEESLDLKPFITSFDYGLILGGGFQLLTENFKGNIEVRYHYGLADLGKVDSDSHFKTSAFVIIAGLLF